MIVHGELGNHSNGQSLRSPVKNSFFEQEKTEGCGREGLSRWDSALIYLAYADGVML